MVRCDCVRKSASKCVFALQRHEFHAIDAGRYYVALSLPEAEAVRARLHHAARATARAAAREAATARRAARKKQRAGGGSAGAASSPRFLPRRGSDGGSRHHAPVRARGDPGIDGSYW